MRRDAPLIEVVVAPFAHGFFKSAKSGSLHMACDIDRTQIGQLHIQVALCRPSALVGEILHTEFVDPHFHTTCTTSIVAYTNHHGLYFAQRRIADNTDFVVGAVLIVGIVNLCVTGCAFSFCLVAFMLQGCEGAEVNIEHVLLRPNSLTTLCSVGVIVTIGGEFERYFVFVIVALVVATNAEEKTHLIVLKFCVTLHCVGMDKHLQMLVVAQVFIEGLINGTSIACGKVLHGECQSLFVILGELRL